MKNLTLKQNDIANTLLANGMDVHVVKSIFGTTASLKEIELVFNSLTYSK